MASEGGDQEHWRTLKVLKFVGKLSSMYESYYK